MQRARRWRTVVKWGLLVGAAGMMLLAAISAKWWISWDGAVHRRVVWICLAEGAVHGGMLPPEAINDGTTGWQLRRLPPQGNSDGEWLGAPNFLIRWFHTSIGVPLWLPFLLTLAPYLLLARADRLAAKRAKAHACPACGYDREGLADGAACPECGKLGAPKAATV